jgi:thiol-disulfide isomerase/thioredoxin
MKRRTLVAAGLGAGAALGGIGLGLWLERRPDAAGADDAGLWNLRLPRPGGGEWSFAQWRGRPLLLNFWATWCPPCVTEMPLLARFHRERRAAGWQVVGIAIDQEKAVREFVEAHGIDFPIALGDSRGLALSQALGNSAGGLPFSVVFGVDGKPRARKLGALDEALLERWGAAPA